MLRSTTARTLLGTLVIIAAAIAYLPALHGQFILDDDLLVTENHVVQAPDGLYRIWFTSQVPDYWPITNSSFWLQWRLWGMNPTGYHVTNVVLHILNSLLLWAILRKLQIPGAFLAAALFAFHPVNVESVAWIAQRKNVLSMLFFLLSLGCYLQFQRALPAEGGELPAATHRPRKKRWYALSLIAFLLAMLSKGSVAVLPPLLLLITWWRAGKITKRDLFQTAPFFLLAIVLSLVDIWFQGHGSGAAIRSAGGEERLLGAAAVVWFYLEKALAPFGLTFVYPPWNIDTADWRWWIPLTSALAVTAALWLLRNSRQAYWARPLLFFWCFFCIALVPVMGFIDVGYMQYSLVADHYQYIALIGVVALVAAGWSILQRTRIGWAKSAAAISAGLVLVGLAILTWKQSGLYAGPIPLYEDTLRKNPDCWLVQNNLGVALSENNQAGAALAHLEQASQINPNSADALARNNLGVALTESGDLEQALELFHRVLQMKPDYPDAEDGLGMALYKAGQIQEALAHVQRAVRLEPNNFKANCNLALLLAKAGQIPEALAQSEMVIHMNPYSAKAHNNIGIVLAEAGRLDEALDHFSQAVQLNPDDAAAYYNFGSALAKARRPQEAVQRLQESLKLKPDYTEAWANLAAAYAAAGQTAEGIAAAQKALALARAHNQTQLAEQIEKWLQRTQSSDNSSQNSPSQPRVMAPAR
ncbi:MAG TPA: tetratricopeptide repeat protein [Pirellulales bacterium]|jgi:tetratricopeptide (TPR) repeat protein|nr:tetratricopeptide repeat protein [Pirellulales bacterium]